MIDNKSRGETIKFLQYLEIFYGTADLYDNLSCFYWSNIMIYRSFSRTHSRSLSLILNINYTSWSLILNINYNWQFRILLHIIYLFSDRLPRWRYSPNCKYFSIVYIFQNCHTDHFKILVFESATTCRLKNSHSHILLNQYGEFFNFIIYSHTTMPYCLCKRVLWYSSGPRINLNFFCIR